MHDVQSSGYSPQPALPPAPPILATAASPRSPWLAPLGLLMAVLVGGGLFVWFGGVSSDLSEASPARLEVDRSTPPRIDPPSRIAPAASAPLATATPTEDPELRRRLLEASLREREEQRRKREARREARLQSRSVVFDRGSDGTSSDSPSERDAIPDVQPVASVQSLRPLILEHPESTVPQGTLIPAVLETELETGVQPGTLRAVVSRDVRSYDGSQVVIPQGSSLVGTYSSGTVRGQTRVAAVWKRILRPDCVAVELEAPGADALGRSGLGGSVDTHFAEIFGASLLLSLIDAGVDIAAENARDNDGNTTIIQGAGSELDRASSIALQNRVNIPPTIRVPRGSQIQVAVNKDIDFSGVGGACP